MEKKRERRDEAEEVQKAGSIQRKGTMGHCFQKSYR